MNPKKKDWNYWFTSTPISGGEQLEEWFGRIAQKSNGEISVSQLKNGWARYKFEVQTGQSGFASGQSGQSTQIPASAVPLIAPHQPIAIPPNKFYDDVLSKIKRDKVPHTIESLSDFFDTGVGKVREAVEHLKSQGFNISETNGSVFISDVIPKSENTVLDIKKLSTGFYKFGVTGDNHLCSRYERLDVLNALYDQFQRDGISIVYNTGNWIDGEARFNKHDLLVHGMDRQIDYWIENYPKRDGIITKYITGDDHEGWYTQGVGINIGKHAERKAREAGRDDLIYLGHMEHDEIIPAKNGYTKMRILHPGGGSSYAISYTSQKIVESYTGADKPHILFDGHYHKAGYNYIRGVHVVQTGCTEDQTPFMRKKKLAAHLGGWEIEFSTDDNGAVTRFKQEFFPFYDREYYTPNAEQWQYKH